LHQPAAGATLGVRWRTRTSSRPARPKRRDAGAPLRAV